MGVHDGHRERIKKRFMEQGLDAFEDHNVLELLLFFAIPRKDTNTIAHNLLNHFDSLDAVFDATAEELSTIEGIGENAEVLIKLIPAISRRCAIDRSKRCAIFNSTEAAGNFLVPRYIGERDEVVYVICLDAKNKLICCKELSRGVANTAKISTRKIAELALAKNASGVIISHNHTSGIAIPSIEDEMTTEHIKSALGEMGINLIDHIVVAGDDFVSMKDSGLWS